MWFLRLLGFQLNKQLYTSVLLHGYTIAEVRSATERGIVHDVKLNYLNSQSKMINLICILLLHGNAK